MKIPMKDGEPDWDRAKEHVLTAYDTYVQLTVLKQIYQAGRKSMQDECLEAVGDMKQIREIKP